MTNIYKTTFSRYNAHAAFLDCIKTGWRSFYMNGLIDRDRIWNELEYITCPVLMVRGKENPVDKIEDIRLTQQKLPNSQLIEVENRGQYLVFKEFGDFFKYALVDFEPEDA